MTVKMWIACGLGAIAAGCGAKEDPGTVRLNGRLEAPLVDLAPKVAGRVVTVHVKEGDRVHAGDLLVVLDLGATALAVDRDRYGVASARARLEDLSVGSRQAEIAAAEAELADRQAAVDLARRELERQAFLLSKQAGAERDHDRARTDLERAVAMARISAERLQLSREGFRPGQTDQARAEMERAQAQLRQSEVVAREAEIRAPADAVVLHRLVEPGQLLTAGQNGLTLAFSDRLYVRTFVPETVLGKVRPGQRATITVDAYPGRQFAGTVTEISPDPEFTPKAVETSAERVNLVYAAKVDLDAGWAAPLVPGQPADISLAIDVAPTDDEPALPGEPRRP